jgi:hypothetical protein
LRQNIPVQWAGRGLSRQAFGSCLSRSRWSRGARAWRVCRAIPVRIRGTSGPALAGVSISSEDLPTSPDRHLRKVNSRLTSALHGLRATAQELAMKTTLTANQSQSSSGPPEGGPFPGTLERVAALPKARRVNIWEEGRRRVDLTIQSCALFHAVSRLRVRDPGYLDIVDLGPADYAPCREDDPPETAAELLIRIHAKRPLRGEALDCARQFLSQWPEGPQIPEKGGVLDRDSSSRLEGPAHYPLAA